MRATFRALALFLAFAGTTSAAADQFGTHSITTIIPVQHFVPTSSGTQHYDRNQIGYYEAGINGVIMWAAIEVPTGVVIDELCLETYDNNDSREIQVKLFAGQTGSATNPVPTVQQYGPLTTGVVAKPLFQQKCFASLGVFPALIPLRTNPSGPFVLPYLLVTVPADPDVGLIAFGPAIVTWHREVRNGPDTATFDDVPTGDPFYDSVEALYAAGIATSCDGGPNFCPDAPVTRKQIALLLARAFGLYWANYANE